MFTRRLPFLQHLMNGLLYCRRAFHLSYPFAKSSSYFVSRCRRWATTARRTTSSSNALAEADRPTRPLYLRQACSAISRSLPAGQPGKSSLTRAANWSHIPSVQFLSAGGLPLPATLPDVLVGQTLLFRFLQRLRFNQQSLPFISLSSSTPFQYNSRKGSNVCGRVWSKPHCQKGGKEDGPNRRTTNIGHPYP